MTGTPPSPTGPYGSLGPYLYTVGEDEKYWTEADRETAEDMAQKDEASSRAMKANYIGQQLFRDEVAAKGYKACIDFGSGPPLPPDNPLHQHVAPARVLYVDNDPQVRQYIHGDNVCFIESRVEEINRVLSVAESCFGDERRVALFFLALPYFISDEDLRHIAQRLYDWAAPDSVIYATSFRPKPNDRGQKAMIDFYRTVRKLTIIPRNEDHLAQLFEPWQLDGPAREIEDIAEIVRGEPIVRADQRKQLGYVIKLTR